jgi:hypothetical protein
MYIEMMGFTQKEVDWLMKETGVNPEYISVDMEAYYNGYLFHKDGENRVYNPAMWSVSLHTSRRTHSAKLPRHFLLPSKLHFAPFEITFHTL